MKQERGEADVNPFQAWMDGLSQVWQKGRSETQMTLGALIAKLEHLDPARKVRGLGPPNSYRGYYEDLAFAPEGEMAVGELLTECRACMGRVYEGYKGGEFPMHANTPLWVAPWGDLGEKLMGLADTDPIRPLTEPED